MGCVQGVGFRPAVLRHAQACGVGGWVRNAPQGVLIEAEGEADGVDRFLDLLRHAPPPQARIETVLVENVPLVGEKEFRIEASARSGDLMAGMPPDLGICADCLRELFDPSNRRFRHPFINCTNCGPRFTIVRTLPYDRERTSMAVFPMCEDCHKEYQAPANRRFDAQPVACPACGPSLRLVDGSFRAMPGDPVASAAALLRGGAIVAVKGLGGYHLACDARQEAAVQLLRARKHRPHKALAVMFRSIDEIRRHCEVTPEEEAALSVPARPIVILARRPNSDLARAVSPDTNTIGAFLSYTPLHALLLEETGPLVMTSGNRTDEPIARNEEELGRLLGTIADAALVHNREILRRCDDSVLSFAGPQRVFIRRSRGLVPERIRLPEGGPPVLACGGDLKNVFCLTRGAEAFASQHIGDLSEHRALEFFEESVVDLQALLQVKPEIVAHDLHPDYYSTRFAQRQPVEVKMAVQHHHAHVVACMVENGITGPVIGLALDGLGHGPDGTVWGGEIVLAGLVAFRRLGHFKPYRLVGGDAATKHPARMALSVLASECGDGAEAAAARLLPSISPADCRILLDMARRGIRSPWTTSAGRLFDAVAALLGLCDTVTYEAQAAIRLEQAAEEGLTDAANEYPFEIVPASTAAFELNFGPTVQAMLARSEGEGMAAVAARFHRTMVAALAAACDRVRQAEGVSEVALSGGVFQNRLLLRLLSEHLTAAGFKVYLHSELPPNDACVAFGQASIALACHSQGLEGPALG